MPRIPTHGPNVVAHDVTMLSRMLKRVQTDESFSARRREELSGLIQRLISELARSGTDDGSSVRRAAR